jgi:hypothetical protein
MNTTPKAHTLNEVLTWLKRRGTRRTVEGMARYGIEAERAFGVTMGERCSR